ncbi:hypothetical protein I4F81_011612 [Pyropia yezoensis]|uniref:Uncharacterized protein n=1 Tax=Pyropia yezoensis TaxID=2788 RepID=A0ACC3CFZ4_PYRYE|nr:hypothetical protein I4F81_011612 [Neopyropia yezoensis]
MALRRAQPGRPGGTRPVGSRDGGGGGRGGRGADDGGGRRVGPPQPPPMDAGSSSSSSSSSSWGVAYRRRRSSTAAAAGAAAAAAAVVAAAAAAAAMLLAAAGSATPAAASGTIPALLPDVPSLPEGTPEPAWRAAQCRGPGERCSPAQQCCNGDRFCVSDTFVANGTWHCKWWFGSYRGMTLTPLSRWDLMSPELPVTIRRMKALNVDTVALVFYEFQADENSSTIYLDYSRYSADPVAVAHAVDVIHAAGLRVLLKPHIGLNNNQFRGIIRPNDAYFHAYKKFIWKWAELAARKRVHAFSVGAELKGLEHASAFWRQVIVGTRKRYGGLVTYAANWDSYQTVTWWDALDFIGVDSYFALAKAETVDRTHTIPELILAWQWVMKNMDVWRSTRWPRKAIVFLESGCRSVRGAAARPWDSEMVGPVDMVEQVNYYKAMFAIVRRHHFIQGVFPWHWEAQLEQGGVADGGYTVWRKPALEVLKYHFRGGPHAAPPVTAVKDDNAS